MVSTLQQTYLQRTALSASALGLSVALAAVLLAAWFYREMFSSSAKQAVMIVSLLMQSQIIALTFVAARRRKAISMRYSSVTSVLYYEQLELYALCAGIGAFFAGLVGLFVARRLAYPSCDFALVLAATPLVLFALTVVRLHVLQRSVADGSFATTTLDALELVHFMLRNQRKLSAQRRGAALLPMSPETLGRFAAGGRRADVVKHGIDLLLSKRPDRTCIGAALGSVAAVALMQTSAYGLDVIEAGSRIQLWQWVMFGVTLAHTPNIRVLIAGFHGVERRLLDIGRFIEHADLSATKRARFYRRAIESAYKQVTGRAPGSGYQVDR